MVEQAKAAHVNIGSAPSTIIANPIIHDKSDSILTGKPKASAEDRDVHYMGGTTTQQRQMNLGSGMSYVDTQQYINYFPLNDPRRQNESWQTGTVDMKGYLEWLNKNGYNINLTVQ